jgi:hypothetical protein
MGLHFQHQKSLHWKNGLSFQLHFDHPAELKQKITIAHIFFKGKARS